MSEQAFHGTAGAGANTARATSARAQTPTGWAGWVVFGGTMMILLGVFSLIEGFVAIFHHQYYVSTQQGLLVFSLTGWGWVHVIAGALAILIGIGVLSGAMWARIAGVIICGLNAIAQLAFMSAYPIWAVIVITLDVLVIYALVAHGREVRDPDW